jgi:hypothetical protein
MKEERPVLSYEERRAIIDAKMEKTEIRHRLLTFLPSQFNNTSLDDVIKALEEMKEKFKDFHNLILTATPGYNNYGYHTFVLHGSKLETDEEFEARKLVALQTKSKSEKRAEELRKKELAELERLKAKYGDI